MSEKEGLKKALTIIELIVTIVIIGILAALALPRFTKTFEATRAREAVAALRQIRTGERIYRTNEEYYYPHFADHSDPEEDEAEINLVLKLFLDTREENWKYKIDTGTADDFVATATRMSGTAAYKNKTIVINQDGLDSGSSTWPPPLPE